MVGLGVGGGSHAQRCMVDECGNACPVRALRRFVCACAMGELEGVGMRCPMAWRLVPLPRMRVKRAFLGRLSIGPPATRCAIVRHLFGILRDEQQRANVFLTNSFNMYSHHSFSSRSASA